YDLVVLPTNQLSVPLTSIAVSTLSRLTGDFIQYRRYYLSALSLLAFMGMGVGADLTLVGKDLVLLLLGPQWEESGRIFTFFGPGIGIMLLYYTHGWIHLSIGRADRWFRWVAVEFTVTGLLFLLGLPWGPVGVAMAWTISFWILLVPAFWYAGRPINFGIAPVVGAIWKYVLASLLASCASALIGQQIPSLLLVSASLNAVVRIVMISGVFTIFYLAAVILLHRGWEPLHQFAAILSTMLPFAFARSSPAKASAIAIRSSRT